MTPRELAELQRLAEEAGSALQRIQDGAGREPIDQAVVRFPRGFLRTATAQRERFPFIRNNDLKANLAYTLILCDTVYWLLIRTDIAATAREMLIKLYLFLGGTMIESITKEFLRGVCGKGYKERNRYLLELKIIDEPLHDDLNWVWDMRNNMHLFLLEEREYVNEYNAQSQSRCTRAFQGLLESLATRGPLDG